MKKKGLSVLLVLVLALSLTGTVLAADLPFEDVSADAWYYQDVMKSYERGFIDGRDETHFAPDATLTYAEAVKLASCMNQEYTLGSVDLGGSDPWYQDYVDYCKAEGIISKDYPWTEPATRAGYVEIFAHALPEEALSGKNDIPDGAIPDVSESHPQASEIYLLYRAGVLIGSDSIGSFNPNDNIRRCEVAAILTRMMDEEARQEVQLGAPAPDGDRTEEVASLAGYWETERPIDPEACLQINEDGSWSLSFWYREFAEYREVENGKIVPSAGEPNAYYAESTEGRVTHFRFTPAEENDVGYDLILWGDEDSIVFLKKEES